MLEKTWNDRNQKKLNRIDFNSSFGLKCFFSFLLLCICLFVCLFDFNLVSFQLKMFIHVKKWWFETNWWKKMRGKRQERGTKWIKHAQTCTNDLVNKWNKKHDNENVWILWALFFLLALFYWMGNNNNTKKNTNEMKILFFWEKKNPHQQM